MTRSPARCGTTSGWSKHQDAGEKPCEACTRAKSEYDARRRDQPEQKRKSRIRAKAQFRAYQTLQHRYPKEYREAYEVALVLVRAEEIRRMRGTETEGDSDS